MGELEEKLNQILSSPDDMAKIMNLAKSISGEPKAPSDTGGKDRGNPPPADAGSTMDPRMLTMLTKLMGEYSSAGKEKTALVATMRPYLREERQEKLDRALKIAKLAHLARIAFSEFSGGDFHL